MIKALEGGAQATFALIVCMAELSRDFAGVIKDSIGQFDTKVLRLVAENDNQESQLPDTQGSG